MTFWLSYRKGSFWLKEQAACVRSATHRAQQLMPLVGAVEIWDSASPRRMPDHLTRAIEIDHTTARLRFDSDAPVG